MLQFENQKIKHIVRKALPVDYTGGYIVLPGQHWTTDGSGDKDYDPPRFIGSTLLQVRLIIRKGTVSFSSSSG